MQKQLVKCQNRWYFGTKYLKILNWDLYCYLEQLFRELTTEDYWISSATPNFSSGKRAGTVDWREGGWEITTTHLHKQQAHTSLSPLGIHVNESFMLYTINITFMFTVTLQGSSLLNFDKGLTGKNGQGFLIVN